MRMLAVLSWMVAWSSTNCSKTQTTDAAGGGEFSGKAAILAPMASSAEPLLRISDFDENPFGYDLTAQLITTRYGNKFALRKEFIKNTHNQALVDTIFHFSSADSKLDIYKVQENEMLFSAKISDPAFSLRNGIRVGLSRNEFCNKFYELQRYRNRQGLHIIDAPEAMAVYQLEILPDQIIISNDAATARYTFLFVQNRLAQIQIEFYLD